MLSFSLVAEALTGLIYHRSSGEDSSVLLSHLPDDGRSTSRNVAKNNMIQDMINSDNIDKGFVDIFEWSLPSQLRVFVRFENSSLLRIWKMSNLVLIFKISFRFTLNKMMVTGVKDHGVVKLLSPFVTDTGCEQTTAIITFYILQ